MVVPYQGHKNRYVPKPSIGALSHLNLIGTGFDHFAFVNRHILIPVSAQEFR